MNFAGPTTIVELALGLGLTFGLAFVSWRFVELPSRQRRRISYRHMLLAISAATLMLLCFWLACEFTGGFQSRLSAEDRTLAAMMDGQAQGRYVVSRFDERKGSFSDAPGRKLLVIGDSYAQDFVNLTVEANPIKNLEIRTYYIPRECQIYFGASDVSLYIEPRFRPLCSQLQDPVRLKDLLLRSDAVVLAGSWDPWAVERIHDSISALHLRRSQAVFVLGPKSLGPINIPHMLLLTPAARLNHRQAPHAAAIETLRLLKARVPESVLVDLQSVICPELSVGCRPMTTGGELRSFDGTHFTPAGAREVGVQLWSRPPLSDWVAR